VQVVCGAAGILDHLDDTQCNFRQRSDFDCFVGDIRCDGCTVFHGFSLVFGKIVLGRFGRARSACALALRRLTVATEIIGICVVGLKQQQEMAWTHCRVGRVVVEVFGAWLALQGLGAVCPGASMASSIR